MSDLNILAQLYSFHGKLLLEEALPFSCVEKNERHFKLLDDMQHDRIQVCQGVQDIKTANLERFLQQCKLPLHEKIKSVFLIEHLCGETVFRSRLCNYVVYNALPTSNPDARDFVRCSECSSYNQRREISFYSYLKRVKSGELDEAFKNLPKILELSKSQPSSEEEDRNLYMRVYLETTDKDKDYHKALNTFKAFSRYGLFSKEGTIKQELADYEQYNEATKTEASEYLLEAKMEVDADSNKPLEDMQIKLNQSESSDQDSLSGWNEIKVKEEEQLNLFFSKTKKKLDVAKKDEERQRKLAERARRKVDQRRRQRQLDKIKGIVRYPNKFKKACTICLHTYKAPSLIQNCMMRHEEELNLDMPVRCPLCFAEIESKRLVTQHFEESHADLGKTCCCECLLVMPRENNRLRRHIIKTHHSAGKPSILCIVWKDSFFRKRNEESYGGS